MNRKYNINVKYGHCGMYDVWIRHIIVFTISHNTKNVKIHFNELEEQVPPLLNNEEIKALGIIIKKYPHFNNSFIIEIPNNLYWDLYIDAEWRMEGTADCLNPCCSGSWSLSTSDWRIKPQLKLVPL